MAGRYYWHPGTGFSGGLNYGADSQLCAVALFAPNKNNGMFSSDSPDGWTLSGAEKGRAQTTAATDCRCSKPRELRRITQAVPACVALIQGGASLIEGEEPLRIALDLLQHIVVPAKVTLEFTPVRGRRSPSPLLTSEDCFLHGIGLFLQSKFSQTTDSLSSMRRR